MKPEQLPHEVQPETAAPSSCLLKHSGTIHSIDSLVDFVLADLTELCSLQSQIGPLSSFIVPRSVNDIVGDSQHYRMISDTWALLVEVSGEVKKAIKIASRSLTRRQSPHQPLFPDGDVVSQEQVQSYPGKPVLHKFAITSLRVRQRLEKLQVLIWLLGNLHSSISCPKFKTGLEFKWFLISEQQGYLDCAKDVLRTTCIVDSPLDDRRAKWAYIIDGFILHLRSHSQTLEDTQTKEVLLH